MKWMSGMLVLLITFVTACSSSSTNTAKNSEAEKGMKKDPEVVSKPIDPYGPFDKTVTISIAQQLPPGDAMLPPGNTVEDNVMTRFYEKSLNIKFNREWNAVTGEPYDQKVMLAIASRKIPDAMKVNEEQLRTMVKAGLLEDITDVYNKYASPNIKRLHNDLAGGKALKTATFDNKLYGIPNISIEGDAVTVLFLRKDWLDKLKLPEPTTMDDITKIAKAFIDNKMGGEGTIGLTGPNTPELANEKGNRTHGFDPVFSSYRSFPRHWVKDDAGKVTYGSIQSQTKDALAVLRKMYADGIIDKEFFLRKDPNELFLSGKNGMFFGPWWMAWTSLANGFKTDPNQVWKAYAAPVDKSGKFVTHLQAVSREYLVIRKGYEHPEALVKGVNLKIGIDRQAKEVPQALADQYKNEIKTTSISNTLDIFRVVTDDINAVTNRRNALLGAMNKTVDPASLDGEIAPMYNILSKYIDDTTVLKYYPKVIGDGFTMSDMAGPLAYIVGGAPMAKGYEGVQSLLYIPTETMKSRWANLSKLENETFLKIIIGEAPLDSFDSFVTEWRKLGGDTIIKEVEDMIKK
ncbi:putative aldouronate transport system substrate-binding protein [Paenibacillus sp. 1_12]|uniref:extracellular solute-binding protein n=1 Tax=Paenibacillus sp. 1_12 TaxID=1566278 RepID=UPI0008E18D17|nr:extracellular solute-binding protein [Paenibacillus sp. 1_12]SFL56138.1 putative aldouronate transport system substrate-binding protein [Paenibacillus sp. 1_12]